MAAKKKTIEELEGDAVSATLCVSSLALPAPRPEGRKLEGDAATQAKTLIQLLRDEAVLRQLCTKLDKYAVEYNGRKRSGVKTGTEKIVEA